MEQKTAADSALRLAIVALLVGWVVAMVWTAGQPDWVGSVATLSFFAAVSAVGAIMQARADRRLDEVELAAARFGARWGLVAGVAFMCLLVFLPPFHSLLTEIAGGLDRTDGGFPRAVEGRMFVLGIVSTFVAQEACRALLVAGWKWSKR